MKNILIFLMLALTLTLSGCAQKKPVDLLEKIKEQNKIIIGTKYDSRPFGFVNEKQELQGFEIDLAREIAKDILGDEKKVVFKQVNASNRILALSSGEVDMIVATMTITPEREQVVNFSNPYFKTGLGLIVPKGSPVRSLKDLNNKPLILVLGTTGERQIRTVAPEIIILGFRTYADGYTALKAHRAEAMATDKSILRGIASQDSSLKVLPQTYSLELYGMAFRKGEASENLRLEVNSVLNRLNKSGKLSQLIRKWDLDDVPN